MPQVSLTSKRVREPEEAGKTDEKVEKKKKKDNKEDTTEFDSCTEHLRVIVEELEFCNFQNI